MLGYLNRAEATREAIDEQGWLHTGDLAVARPDGAITLIGRLKEMFKSGGYNVYPREIEIALEAHPAVRLAAVIGVPDPLYVEVGHAFVVADGVTDAELREHCRTRLANYKVPKRFTISADLRSFPSGRSTSGPSARWSRLHEPLEALERLGHVPSPKSDPEVVAGMTVGRAR
jgi:acyl-CoA synthetase (AMP-forming)/AMP-acid ligase II